MIIQNKNKASGLVWIEKISVLLDSKFTFPGTRFKFGLDPLLGLFPIFGDFTSFIISCALLLHMVKYGASRKVLILMAGNIIIDVVIGSIPILGNIFDFTFKANNRNIKLLKKYYEEGKYRGSGNSILMLVGVGLVFIMGLVIYILILLAQFIYTLIISAF